MIWLLAQAALGQGFDHEPVGSTEIPGRVAWIDSETLVVMGYEQAFSILRLDGHTASLSYPCEKVGWRSLHPDASRLSFTCKDDNTVRLHTLEPWEEVGRWEASRKWVWQLMNAAGDRFVVVKGKKGAVLDLDNPGQTLGTFAFRLGGYEVPLFGQDGRTLVRHKGKRQEAIDIDTGAAVSAIPRVGRGASPDGAYQVVVDGAHLRLLDASGEVLAEDKLTHNVGHVLGDIANGVQAMGGVPQPTHMPRFTITAWDPAGQFVIAGTNKGQLRQYAIPSLEHVASYTGVEPPLGIHISPDSRYIAAGGIYNPGMLYEVFQDLPDDPE